jgi:hypothetical protein
MEVRMFENYKGYLKAHTRKIEWMAKAGHSTYSIALSLYCQDGVRSPHETAAYKYGASALEGLVRYMLKTSAKPEVYLRARVYRLRRRLRTAEAKLRRCSIDAEPDVPLIGAPQS